jgi:ATP-binding cassette subfamily F protein uup
MDHVVTSLIVLDGSGDIGEFVGGYSDWEARGGRFKDPQQSAAPRDSAPAKVEAKVEAEAELKAVRAAPTGKGKVRGKLSHKEQRELDKLPAQIEQLEQQQAELQQQMSAPGFYQSGHAEIQRVTTELASVHAGLEKAFNRWNELESSA